MTAAPLVLAALLGAGAADELAARGIHLPADAPDALARELLEGLSALPPAVRAPPAPVRIELHDEPAPFGMGDGEARPIWTDGGATFHLYALGKSHEDRATFRLERLTAEQQTSLWRRRAAVHLVLARWDAERSFSARPLWRRVAGWLGPLDRPTLLSEKNVHSWHWAQSRLLGRVSSSLDLVTFAEEALWPAEALVPGAVPPDDQVRCQELGKSRALHAFLGELDRTWRAPPRGPCPAFDAWARAGELSHVEVLFAAASSVRPESIFGHVLLRPVWREGELVASPTLQPVWELGALTSPVEDSLRYLVRGTTGGFSNVLGQAAFGEALLQNLQADQRTLRRYRLRLSALEQERLLERIWELERKAYLEYWFFTENCARALLWIVEGALDEHREVGSPGTFWVMPTATLDALAEAGGPGEPLLERLPEDLLASSEVAARALRRREALFAALPEGARIALAPVHEASLSHDPPARELAYRGLPAAVDAALAAAPPAAIHEWLACTVEAERSHADRAAAALSKLDLARLVIPPEERIPTADELRVERQRAYQREDAALRMSLLLAHLDQARRILDHAPRRAPTEQEAHDEAQSRAALAAFATLVEAQGAIVDRHFPEVDARALAEGDRAARIDEASALAATALPSSGTGRLWLGGGARGTRTRTAPYLSLRTASLAEATGERRARGFDPSADVRILDGELRLEPRADELPRSAGTELVVVGFRTLAREPEHLADGLLDRLGWGGAVEADHRPGRFRPYRALAHLELYGLAEERHDLAGHTALGLGPAVQGRFSWWGMAIAGGPALSLLHRTPLGGSTANAVTLDARWLPAWSRDLRGVTRLESEVAASASLELLAGSAFGRPLVVAPALRFERTDAADLRPAWEALGAIQVEILPSP